MKSMENEQDGCPEQRPQVTGDQFKANERAWQIRSVCVEIVDVLESDLAKPDRWQRVREQLKALRLLGVRPNMHLGYQKGAYDNPVIMAEYTAGQLLAMARDSHYPVWAINTNLVCRFFDIQPEELQ